LNFYFGLAFFVMSWVLRASQGKNSGNQWRVNRSCGKMIDKLVGLIGFVFLMIGICTIAAFLLNNLKPWSFSVILILSGFLFITHLVNKENGEEYFKEGKHGIGGN